MADASTPPAPTPKKTAVVLIHGIGEQRPMATLWKLVEIAWMSAPCGPGDPPRRVYSEPDEVSGVFELRRLSTNGNAEGKRTDFFEYYWAHQMSGNELGDVIAWLSHLATRPKDQVPPQLQKAWTWLRRIAFAVPFLALFFSGGTIFSDAVGNGVAVGVILFFALLAVAAVIAADQVFFSPVLGDAARYLRPTPKNIACRQAIRAGGVALLESLHDSGKYDRIVVVGHSLGGVIGYELIGLLWGRRNRALAQAGPVQAAIAASEAAALALDVAAAAPQRAGFDEAFARWREAQAALFAAIAAQDDRLWLISDLVTLGSPLAHGDTLMAADPKAFALALGRRELEANPPVFEHIGGAPRFSYCRAPGLADDPDAEPRCLHNAAAFAATRWTNIYFPQQGLMRGDLVGGPVAPLFGPGVRDVAARAPGAGAWFPHLDYFRLDDDGPWGEPDWADHRVALREAIGLDPVPAPASLPLPAETA